jgi:hypothetical protein
MTSLNSGSSLLPATTIPTPSVVCWMPLRPSLVFPPAHFSATETGHRTRRQLALQVFHLWG